MRCNKCGRELRITQEQIGVGNSKYTVNVGYCDNCNFRYDLNNIKIKKKDSTLSIIAIVLSIFTITAFIGFIIALIDLCMNDKTKKHTGSWFSVIFFLLVAFVFAASSNKENSSSNNNTNTAIESTQIGNIQYSKGVSFDTDQCKVTIDSANMNYTNYEDEYSLYEPENGMKYVYVTFTYENTSNSDAYVSIYDYDCYADGELMQQCYYFGGDFINANISPGRKVSFSTTYIVPRDSESIELEYKENNLFDDSTIVITLK